MSTLGSSSRQCRQCRLLELAVEAILYPHLPALALASPRTSQSHLHCHYSAHIDLYSLRPSPTTRITYLWYKQPRVNCILYSSNILTGTRTGPRSITHHNEYQRSQWSDNSLLLVPVRQTIIIKLSLLAEWAHVVSDNTRATGIVMSRTLVGHRYRSHQHIAGQVRVGLLLQGSCSSLN